jgi:hypothetical protein
MILHPNTYVPEVDKGHPELVLHSHDILAREEHFELVKAQEVMKSVLKYVGIAESDLRKTVESTGANWFEMGDEILLPWPKLE